MVILVLGGSGSGKSEYAENRCMQLEEGQKLYIATMEAYDEESRARVARHRRMRSGKGFDTLECYTHLEEADIPEGQTVLLECLSNLTANEMFSPSGRKENTADIILAGMGKLVRKAGNVVIVTNQVFSDGIVYAPETEHYLRTLAQLNASISRFADEVVEVIHGIPVFLKGKSGEERE